ncbi:anhydro-N-acetylmuramic acid kinase [bacterium]|jgi:anhydro-N-acetylmuramic acid kinase|nr:anhydro-N-acetylmuramic acid kinase [bacterium]
MVLEEGGWNLGPTTRVFAGVSVGRTSGTLKLAILRSRGQGWQWRAQHLDGLTLDQPSPAPMLDIDPILEGLDRLCEETAVPRSAIDSLGILNLPGDEVGLAQKLAEATGITTLCRFGSSSTLGLERPWMAMGDWLLFRSSKTPRIVVDLGSVVRLTFLPSHPVPRGIISFDVGPGNHFLNELVHRLSQGRYAFDPSGHFAVQGQQDEEILSHWSSHPFLLKAPPRFLDVNLFGERFIESSMTMARERRRAAKDLLCTASHFIAGCLKDALHRFLPETGKQEEVFLVGGGVRNGLLRKLIEEALWPREIRPSTDVGVADEIRSAAHAALLAFMAMENLAIPGVDKVLGTIIPGSKEHWDRWVCHLADRFDADARRAA